MQQPGGQAWNGGPGITALPAGDDPAGGTKWNFSIQFPCLWCKLLQCYEWHKQVLHFYTIATFVQTADVQLNLHASCTNMCFKLILTLVVQIPTLVAGLIWLFFSQKGLILSKALSELHIHSKCLLTRVYGHWPCRVQRILERFYCWPENALMDLLRNKCSSV